MPLHYPPGAWFDTTADELPGVFGWLAADPARCWTIGHLRQRGLA